MKYIYQLITYFFIVLFGVGVDGIIQIVPYADKFHSMVVSLLYYFFIGGLSINGLANLKRERHK